MGRRCRLTLSQIHRLTPVTSQVSGLILETGVDRGGGAAGTIISLGLQCLVRGKGIAATAAAPRVLGEFRDADRDRNTLSSCALGSEEASLTAAHLVRRPDGQRDGIPQSSSDD